MPRWASRISLEVTDVRVQRVQEISAIDCEAEGLQVFDAERIYHANEAKFHDDFYRDAYKHLWDSLNAKRGFGWDVNPWVWAITFKQVTA